MTIDQWINILMMLGTILAPVLTIIGFIFFLIRNRISIPKYNLYPNGFTDRHINITNLNDYLNNKSHVINIYGKRGVGKSAFLKFYCDLLNGKLDKVNSSFYKIDYRRYRNLKKVNALYIELSGYNDGTKLYEQISEQLTGDRTISLYQISKRIKNYLFKSKLIVLVLDNINNIGLEKEIEDIIRTFASISNKFVFIVGSIEKLSLLNLINSKRNYIQLSVFEEKDIFEFAKKTLKTQKS
jgi:Cdc6-like AAA superfamily ATPase